MVYLYVGDGSRGRECMVMIRTKEEIKRFCSKRIGLGMESLFRCYLWMSNCIGTGALVRTLLAGISVLPAVLAAKNKSIANRFRTLPCEVLSFRPM